MRHDRPFFKLWHTGEEIPFKLRSPAVGRDTVHPARRILSPPPQRPPRLHEFLYQPWRRQSQRIATGIVRGLIERFQLMPLHRMELYTQRFEFRATELFG